MLCQLHLQLPFPRVRVASEHIQNQRGAINHLDLEGRFQVALLGWRQLVVADNHVGAFCFQQLLQFLQLALADVGWSEPVGPLLDGGNHFGAGRTGQVVQLDQRILNGPQLLAPIAGFSRNQHRPLSLRAGRLSLAVSGHSKYGSNIRRLETG